MLLVSTDHERVDQLGELETGILILLVQLRSFEVSLRPHSRLALPDE